MRNWLTTVARALRTGLARRTSRRVLGEQLGRLREELAAVARRQEEVERLVRAEADRLVSELLRIEKRARSNLYVAGQRDAAQSSAQFALAQMPTAPFFDDPRRTLAHGLSLAPEEGMALEFGVYTGESLRQIAAARRGYQVYGFDSFQGLPEDWRSTVRAGSFAMEIPPVVEGAELVVGLFADTLPSFLDTHSEWVAFLHLDADIYSSTKTVLDHVGPRLREGTVIVFDEYFNYAGWEGHEHRAWQEFVERTGTGFAYEGYTVDHQQVIVRVTNLPSEV
ncbi:class I SAM-dependent methyltransferase [Geodermatophilus sp. SYSU D00742]